MNQLQLIDVVNDFCDGIHAVDSSGPLEKTYRPGIGPLTEARTVQLVYEHIANAKPIYSKAKPMQYPGERSKCDIVIPDEWALEFKLARPFGDNGKPAEHWIENLLYPYPGNQSVLGDCMKLLKSGFGSRKAVIIFGFEHTPPRLDLEIAIAAYETIARTVLNLQIGERISASCSGLIHPHHQQATVWGWEVVSSR
jgi:hypothetical protein